MLLSNGMAAHVKLFLLILSKNCSLVNCQVANQIQQVLLVSSALLVCIYRNSTLQCGISLKLSQITASLLPHVSMFLILILLFQLLKFTKTLKMTASTTHDLSMFSQVTSLLLELDHILSHLLLNIFLRLICKPLDQVLITLQ